MPSIPSFRTDKGFTLIEVMVSLAIMGLIVTVAFAGLRIGLNSWERGGARIDALDAHANVERLLSRQLAVASPMPLRVKDQMVPLFRGTNARVEFISDYSPATGSGEFRKIDYGQADGDFLYGEKQLDDYVPTDDEPLPTEKLASFQSIQFRFLAVEKDGSFKWVDEWKADMGLPAAVEAMLGNRRLLVRLVNR
jgi:prepilin-type N-terminal cleavage/methylation domain-containing protein